MPESRTCQRCGVLGVDVLPIFQSNIMCVDCSIKLYAVHQPYILASFVSTNLACELESAAKDMQSAHEYFVSVQNDMLLNNESDDENYNHEVILDCLADVEQLRNCLVNILVKSLTLPVQNGTYAKECGVTQEVAEQSFNKLKNHPTRIRERYAVMEKLLRAIE